MLMVGGTASHVHVSLKKGTTSPDAKIAEAPGMTELESQFVAGLLEHYQAASAFILSTMASYERLVDGAWAVVPPPSLSLSVLLSCEGRNVYLMGCGKSGNTDSCLSSRKSARIQLRTEIP